MKKKLFSFLLAVLLIVSVLPGAASAAEAEAAQQPRQIFRLELPLRATKLTGPLTRPDRAISEATLNAVRADIIAGLKNWAASIDVSKYNLSYDDCKSCYYGVLLGRPEFFYVETVFAANGSMSAITSINPQYNDAYTKSSATAFNSVSAAIIAGMPNGTREEKLLYIHDYIVTHCKYDLTYQGRDAYACLVQGSAVCQGYSLAFVHLCNLAGLEAIFVSSDELNHAWNLVRLSNGGIENAWYLVDCTWDDPILSANPSLWSPTVCTHEHFLVCREDALASHNAADWVNAAGENARDFASTEAYRYGWWKNLRENVTGPVQWVGNKMAYGKSNDFGNIYFHGTNTTTETTVPVPGGGVTWPVWGGGGSFWTEAHFTVAAHNGMYYFTTPTQIWKMTAAGETSLAYTLSSAELSAGRLYGLQSEGGKLYYYYGTYEDNVNKRELSIPLEMLSVKANKTTAAVGEAVTWTAAAAGGSGSLRYCFYVYQGSTVEYKGSYGTAKTFTYTPASVGSYTVKAFVRDGAGTTVSLMSGATAVTAAPLSITSVTANKSSATVGQAITWTATATGGSGTYQYCFYIFKDGAVVEKGSYGSAKTYTYTPTAPGSYTARAYVKSGSTSVNKTSGATAGTAAPLSITSVTANKSSATVGQAITWTATAAGGSGTYQYCFYIFKDGAVVQKGSYGSAKTYTYTPTAPGSYTARAYVKIGSTSVNKMSGATTVTAAPLSITAVTANKTSAKTGETITWTATATGGSSALQYCFYLFKDGKILERGSYGTARTFSFTPDEPGTYTVRAYVKSGSETVNLTSAGTAVKAAIYIDYVEVWSEDYAVYDTITWYAEAHGGTGPLQYCFYVFLYGKLVERGSYSASYSYDYLPEDPGTYTVRVYVKDSAGTVEQLNDAGGIYIFEPA